MLTGLIAPPHTPMLPGGELNLEVVQRQAEHFGRHGIRGVFVAGSTGEASSLTVDERLRLAARWVEAARGTSLQVIIQVGHNCQADAVHMAAHAQSIGADAIAAHAPCYFKPETVEDLIEFCRPVAAAAADLPFYFYDIPMLTGVQLPMERFLGEGQRRIPNLAGLKYTNIDLMQMQQCVALDGGRFNILFGCDQALLAGLALGAHGAVGTTYNFAAPLYARMIESLEQGHMAHARAEQAKAVEMIEILMTFGFSAAAKAVMGMIGIECGPVRSPLRNLTSGQRDALLRQLEQAGLFDAWYSTGQWQPAGQTQRGAAADSKI